MNEAPPRCWAEIDLAAIRHNAEVARSRMHPGGELLAVIKANGYGHGLARIAQALGGHAQYFGVANYREALEARSVVPHPLLILGPALPEELPLIARAGFIVAISSVAEAEAFSRAASEKPAQANVVVDTGMGRIGIPQAGAIAALEKIAALKNLHIHSLSTHLPAVEDDAAFTDAQLARFNALVDELGQRGLGKIKTHVLPSAALLGRTDGHFDIVRAGLMLYGISPQSEFQPELRPALALKTRVVLVREIAAGSSISYGRTFIAPRAMRVATLSAGYADGYTRALSNRGAEVLIRGKRCAVLGRITMDLMMADVSALTGIVPGEEAVLIGRQGMEEILASELARRAGTIAWEIFTGIGSRVERVYH